MTVASAIAKLISLDCPALPNIQPLEAGKNRILNRWPDVVATPPEKERERLVQEIRTRLEGDRWEGTHTSLVTAAGRALFDADRRARPDLLALREFYFAEIRASSRRAFLEGMFSVYLGSYQPRAPHTIGLASALGSAKSKLGARSQTLLRNVPELLDPVRAPEAVAALMFRMEDCWHDLKALGLRTPRRAD